MLIASKRLGAGYRSYQMQIRRRRDPEPAQLTSRYSRIYYPPFLEESRDYYADWTWTFRFSPSGTDFRTAHRAALRRQAAIMNQPKVHWLLPSLFYNPAEVSYLDQANKTVNDCQDSFFCKNIWHCFISYLCCDIDREYVLMHSRDVGSPNGSKRLLKVVLVLS